jgi:hypothetical protein
VNRRTWGALLARLREPSSMAGLSALLLLAGAAVPTVALVTQAAAGVLGLAAVFVPEHGDGGGR